MEPQVSAHTPTLPNKPSRAVLSDACPHHVTSKNQTTTPADNHSGTRLGDTRGFAEPLKATGHSFFGEKVTTGGAEPPVTGAELMDRPAPAPGVHRCPSPWLCLLSLCVCLAHTPLLHLPGDLRHSCGAATRGKRQRGGFGCPGLSRCHLPQNAS